VSSNRRTLSTFRLHLVITSVVVAGAYGLVIAAATFAPLVSQLNRGELDRNALLGVADTILYLHATYWPLVAGMLVATIASALILFRRMTSPLVRFVAAFDAVARGEVPPTITIRNADYVQDEADSLNRMLSGLGERAAARERAVAQIEEALAELEACSLEPKAAAAVGQGREGLRILREGR
jgi:methyl-accepting chemotaxis protein